MTEQQIIILFITVAIAFFGLGLVMANCDICGHDRKPLETRMYINGAVFYKRCSKCQKIKKQVFRDNCD